MDKKTKEAWISRKNISPEALEKRKNINKKIWKFGCLPIILLFGLIMLIGIFSDKTSETSSTENDKIVNKTIDSLQIKKEKIRNDSIAVVNKKRKIKAEKLLKTFKVSKDEFEGTTFYRDPRTPYYTNVNFIYPYIGQKGNNYWLRLKFQYAADDWLFINKGILLIDGEKFTVTGNWKRDNNSRIWEWLDIPVNDNELLILNKIANSKSAKIRYVGDKYYNDRNITRKEKNIIKKTLEIYNNLK